MSDVVFQGNADFAPVEKAFHKIAQENVKLLHQIGKLQQAQNNAARDDRQNKSQSAALQKQAQQMMERSATPVENYRAALAKAQQQLDGNKMSAAEFRAEKQRLQSVLQKELAQFESQNQALRKAAEQAKVHHAARMSALKKRAQEEQRLAAIAKKAIDETRTPFERYERQLHEIDQALDAGVISTEDYRRAKVRLLRQLRDAKREQSGENEELKEAARVTASTRTATERYAAAVDRLNRLKRSGKITSETYRRAVDKEKQSLKGSESALGKFRGKFMIATAAATAFVAVMNRVAAAAREVREEVADSAVGIDTLSRKLQIQAGIADSDRSGLTKDVLEIAERRGVEKEDAFAAAQQTFSSGFQNPVETGVTEAFIKGGQATNFEGDLSEIAKPVGQVLAGFGEEKSKDNVERVLTDIHGLFKQTDVQVTDLGDVAKVASVAKEAGLSMEEMLASFASFRDVLDPAEASTALKNFIVILETAGDKKQQREAVESLGLKAEDVDFVGESISEVATKLRDAVQKMPKEQANLAMGRLFGRENIGSAQAFINSADKIDRYVKFQGDQAAFERDVQTASEGKQAELNRFDTRDALHQLNGAGDAAFELKVQHERIDEFRRQRRDEILADEDTPQALKTLQLASNKAGQFVQHQGAEFGIDTEFRFNQVRNAVSKIPLYGDALSLGGGHVVRKARRRKDPPAQQPAVRKANRQPAANPQQPAPAINVRPPAAPDVKVNVPASQPPQPATPNVNVNVPPAKVPTPAAQRQPTAPATSPSNAQLRIDVPRFAPQPTSTNAPSRPTASPAAAASAAPPAAAAPVVNVDMSETNRLLKEVVDGQRATSDELSRAMLAAKANARRTGQGESGRSAI